MEIAVEVLSRLRTPPRIQHIASTSATRLEAPGLWDASSYATGFAGLAVAQLVLSDLDPTSENVAAHHMRTAIEQVGGRSTISVIAGFGSLAAAAVVASGWTSSYAALATRGCDWLAVECDRVCSEQHARWRAGETWADERMWDAACGLGGAGRVLAAAHQQGLGDYKSTLRSICSVLVRLTEPATGPGGVRVPGWWIRPGTQPRCIDGGWNPGLAHGISGPLVTLAALWRAGITVPGHRDAIGRITGALTQARTDSYRWPHTVPLRSLHDSDTVRARSAWCYGAAGVARALYLAGASTGDHEIVDDARTVFGAIAGQDVESWNLWGPTFCHGHAGMLQIINRTAVETGDAVLADQAARLAAIIMASYRDSYEFGFAHVHDRSGPTIAAGDFPGVLTGAAGTALSLISWAKPDTPAWDLPLLTT